MSHIVGLVIESVVAILLLLTIGYCFMLNRRLKRLKADEQALKATISELITATEMAERAVAGLKLTASDCQDTLGERLRMADRVCADLTRQVKAGEVVLTRLSRVVVAARSLNEIPEAVATPDPKALASAAQSFADRMRERVGTIAA